MTRLLAKDVMLAPLPELQVGESRTKSHALHDEEFVGPEEHWAGFLDEVLEYFNNTPWQQYKKVISYRPGPNTVATVFSEHVPCGDEATVQSRFIQNVSQHMNAISSANDIDTVMTDYKSCINPFDKGVPDVVLLDRQGLLKVVGEIKAWWIPQHDLMSGMVMKDKCWKQLLGQVARYMKEGCTKYGFLSTYNESIFLKQEFVGGKWRLFVSDIVNYNANSRLEKATLRQCFWYLMNRANYRAVNTTPNNKWVICEKD